MAILNSNEYMFSKEELSLDSNVQKLPPSYMPSGHSVKYSIRQIEPRRIPEEDKRRAAIAPCSDDVVDSRWTKASTGGLHRH